MGLRPRSLPLPQVTLLVTLRAGLCLLLGGKSSEKQREAS